MNFPKILILLISFWLGGFHLSWAQFRSGYIIANSGTVQNGSIEKDFNFFNGCSIKFKNTKGKVKKYKPGSISGFAIGDSTYISLDLNFRQPTMRSAVIKSDFVRVLVDDEIALYQHEYKKEQVWLYSPTNTQYILRNNLGISILPTNLSELQSFLVNYFKSFEDLSITIAQNGIPANNLETELIKWTKAYNEWIKSQR